MAAGAAALSAEWTSTPTLRPLLASAAMRDAVLLVEREAPMRDHLSRQLADDGFAVFAADRASAALELVETERPDLVLLDAVLCPTPPVSTSAAAFEPGSRDGPGTATSR